MFPRRSNLLLLTLLVSVSAHTETIRNPTKKKGAGPLFQIERNNKWGFMDRTGRIVIQPAFFDERDFFHGLAAVESPEGKWGYIDESGNLAIRYHLDEVRDFIGDLAPVRVERKWGYIDITGKIAIEPRFQTAGEFHEGLARVHVWSKVACSTGTFTSESAPMWAFRFLEDGPEMPGCIPQGGKFGFIDKTGTLVIAPQFFVAQANSVTLIKQVTWQSRPALLTRIPFRKVSPPWKPALG